MQWICFSTAFKFTFVNRKYNANTLNSTTETSDLILIPKRQRNDKKKEFILFFDRNVHSL